MNDKGPSETQLQLIRLMTYAFSAVMVVLGLLFLFTDILTPNGNKLLGALLVGFGVLDAVVMPLVLERSKRG